MKNFFFPLSDSGDETFQFKEEEKREFFSLSPSSQVDLYTHTPIFFIVS